MVVWCGKVVEKDRFDVDSERLRKAAESEIGEAMAALDWRPAIESKFTG